MKGSAVHEIRRIVLNNERNKRKRDRKATAKWYRKHCQARAQGVR